MRQTVSNKSIRSWLRPLVMGAGVAALIGFAQAASAKSAPLEVQPNVDLTRYMGTWYEQARLPNWFQHKCDFDTTAQYTANADGTVQVLNSCVRSDSKVVSASGVARLSHKLNPQTTSVLQVRFPPAPFWGDYWIMKVGANYEYAVVGTPNRKYLWILSRQKHLDTATLDNLINYAKSQGFDASKVVRSPQH